MKLKASLNWNPCWKRSNSIRPPFFPCSDLEPWFLQKPAAAVSRSPRFQRVKKASQSLPPAGGKGILIIFCRGVYLTENTTQAASVRIVRRRRARRARGRLQSFCQKRAKPFFDSLKPAAAVSRSGRFFIRLLLPDSGWSFRPGPRCSPWRGYGRRPALRSGALRQKPDRCLHWGSGTGRLPSE